MDAVRSAVAPDGAPLPIRLICKLLRRNRYGSVTLEFQRQRLVLEGRDSGPNAHVHILEPWALLRRLAARGSIGFAEAYMAGEWESAQPTTLLRYLLANESAYRRRFPGSTLARWSSRLLHLFRANTRRGSRRNIAAHYDLGNDFYRLWLDDSMTYSAGIFRDPAQGLDDAQVAKYTRMLDLVGAESGDRILEIGCGWGGFAEQATSRGVAVTGVTLSREQLHWARTRLGQKSRGDLADLRFQDYRDIEGEFSHIVSIEMFEAVGERYWPLFMRRIHDLLEAGGRAALQVIVIDESVYARYRENVDFIQRYIFPGGMLPTVPIFGRQARAAGLRVAHREFGGQDYAETLACWHSRFLQQLSEVRRQGYDERFIRMWRYYLAYCEAGFRDGRIDLMRVVLTKPETTL